MSSFKTTVEKFLKANGIVPVLGPLREDLDEDNEFGLEYIAYAIRGYPALPGLLPGVKALATVEDGGFENERIYENKLTEFMGIWFVSEVLKEKVVRLESPSPHRKGGKKTCDLETATTAGACFYEVKDFSSEILTQVTVDVGVTSFTPGLPFKIKPWIEGYVQNCIEKGANYLVCSVPAWHVRGRPKLREDWVKRIYAKYQVLSPSRFRVDHGLSVPGTFKGVYVIRRDEHLLMEF